MSNRVALDEKFHLVSRDSSFVLGLLIEGEGEPFYAKWVKKRKGKGKKTFIEVLCVVGQFRLFVIKKKSSRKLEVMENLSISYEIEHVQLARVLGDSEVIISSKASKMSEKRGLEVELLDDAGPNELIQALVQAGHYACYDFPKDLPFKLSTAADSSDALSPLTSSLTSLPPSPAGNFVPAYLAACDYLQIDPFPGIDRFVRGMTGDRTLDLDRLGGGGDMLHSCDLLPIFLALKHNHFFTGIKLSYVPPGVPGFPSINLTAKLSVILSVNPTLSTVVWTGQGLRLKEVTLLSNALIKNACSPLAVVDLSDNPLFTAKDKGEDALMGFIHFVRAFPDTVHVLRFRGVGMGKNEAHLFFQTLQDKIFPRVTEFDIARNPIGSSGAAALLKLISHPLALRSLSLAACDIPAPRMVELLHRLEKAAPVLALLDISCTPLDTVTPDVVDDMCSALAGMKSLTTLKLNDCKASGSTIAKILLSSCKDRSSPVTIEINGNSIGPAGHQDVADALPQCKNISSLSVARNNLGCIGISTILKALDGFDVLEYFDISENINMKMVRERDRIQTMTDALKVFSFSHPSLKTLIFRGCLKSELYAGASFIEAISIIVSDSRFRVTTLDVSENGGGETATTYLYAALESNDTLTSIAADGNMCGMKGVQALRTLLSRNTVITSVKIPTEDIDAMVKAIKSKQDQRTLMTTVSTATQQIRSSLNDNCRRKAKAKQKKKKLVLKKEESKSNETSSKRKNAESSEGAKGKDREKKKEKKKDKKTCEKKPEKRVEETPAAQEAPEAEQKAPLSPKESTADNVSSSSNSSSNVSEANGEESPKTDEKKLKPKAIAKVVNSARPRSYSENIATPASQPSAEDKDESDSTDKEKKEAVPPTPPRPMMKRKLGPKFPGAKSLPRSGPTKSAAPPLSVTTTPASAATTPPTPTRGHMSLSGIPGLLPPAVPPPRPKVQAQPQVQTHPKVQVKEVPVKVQAKEALPAKQHTKETPAPAPTQNTSGGFKAAQARPSASTTHGQLIGVHTHKKVSVGIVVAPGTCSSTPPVSRPPIPPRTPRSGPVFHQPPPLVLPPSAQKKKDAGKEKEKGMVLKNEKELKEKKEDKEEVVPHAKTSPPSAPIPEEKNEGSTAEAKEVVVVEEKEKEEEEEEEEWEEENKGKGEGDKGDGDDEDKGENGEDDDSNDGETMAEDDDDYDVYVEEKPTEMGFGGMSGDAFLADGGMSFFRDRKIARKSMMYKDTWWTTLRPAKMEAMPITPLLPEDGPDGNDEAIPGFDDNITAVPSMATEIGGDPEEEQSSLPLI